MTVLGMAACAADTMAVNGEGNELGTSQQALSGGAIQDDTHYSINTYVDEHGVSHSRSSLKTTHKRGSCKNGSVEEVYEFEANYASQGLTAKGALTVQCSNWTVKVVTARNTYEGSIQLGEDGLPYSMYWQTSVGVTWLLNWN